MNKIKIPPLKDLPPHTWSDVITKYMIEIIKATHAPTPQKMSYVIDAFATLHTEAIRLTKKDPERALEIQFDLVHGMYVFFSELKIIHKREGGYQKMIQRAEPMLELIYDRLKKLLQKNPPQDISAFSERFFSLPFHGIPFSTILENLADFWGDQELDIIENHAYEVFERLKYSTYNNPNLSQQDKKSLQSVLTKLKNLLECFPLLRGNMETYVEKTLGKEKAQDSTAVAELADKIHLTGLTKNAELCLATLNPLPPMSSEHNKWFSVFETFMRRKNHHEEARALRWKYFTTVKDDEAAILFMNPWYKEYQGPPQKAEYFEDVQLIRKMYLEEWDFEVSVKACLILCHLDHLEDLLDELMLRNRENFKNAPNSIFISFATSPYLYTIDTEEYQSPVATLLAFRELIKRCKAENRSHESIQDFIKKVEVLSQKIKEKTQKITPPLPSHSEFMKSLDPPPKTSVNSDEKKSPNKEEKRPSV